MGRGELHKQSHLEPCGTTTHRPKNPDTGIITHTITDFPTFDGFVVCQLGLEELQSLVTWAIRDIRERTGWERKAAHTLLRLVILKLVLALGKRFCRTN